MCQLERSQSLKTLQQLAIAVDSAATRPRTLSISCHRTQSPPLLWHLGWTLSMASADIITPKMLGQAIPLGAEAFSYRW